MGNHGESAPRLSREGYTKEIAEQQWLDDNVLIAITPKGIDALKGPTVTGLTPAQHKALRALRTASEKARRTGEPGHVKGPRRLWRTLEEEGYVEQVKLPRDVPGPKNAIDDSHYLEPKFQTWVKQTGAVETTSPFIFYRPTSKSPSRG